VAKQAPCLQRGRGAVCSRLAILPRAASREAENPTRISAQGALWTPWRGGDGWFGIHLLSKNVQMIHARMPPMPILGMLRYHPFVPPSPPACAVHGRVVGGLAARVSYIGSGRPSLSVATASRGTAWLGHPVGCSGEPSAARPPASLASKPPFSASERSCLAADGGSP
jgi:hypothetical protein